MMMKKTTSALAVAALLGTGAASAATFQVNDDTTFSISGDIEAIYQDVDAGSSDTSTVIDSGSEIKFDGEQTSSNGLTAFFHTELGGFDITSDSGDVSSNDTRFGVKGDFGTVTFGDVNTAFDDVADIADLMFDAVVTVGGSSANNQTLQYVTPTLDGFVLAIDTQLEASDDDLNTNGGTETTFRVEYDVGGINLLAGAAQDESFAGGGEKVAIGATGSVSGISVGVKFQAEDTSASADRDLATLAASTSLGGGFGVHGVVNNVSPSSGDSRTEIAFGASYSLADNFGLHVEQLLADQDNGNGDKFVAGATLKF